MVIQNNNKDFFLVKALKKGDIAAFDKCMQVYGKKIFFFVKKYIINKEDTEDIVQEVFIKIWENRIQLKEELSFNSYIYTITYNAIRKYYRNRYLSIEHINKHLKDYKDFTDNSNLQIEFNETQELVNKAISLLPERRRIVFQLSRQDGLSYNEIAEKLGIKPKTVENQIHEALVFIKKYLGDLNSPNMFLLICIIHPFLKSYF